MIQRSGRGAYRGIRLSHQMVHTLSPHLGTRLYAFGNSLQEPRLDASSATPMMFSPSPSPPTTARSSQDLVTRQSSCGTHLETANSRYKRRSTPIGFLACDSVPTLRIRSSSARDGINLSRYVEFDQIEENWDPSQDALQSISICYFRAHGP